MLRRNNVRRLSALRLGPFLALLALPAGAQIPDSFSNLEVLPEDIGKRQLIEVMQNFTRALGVHCLHCHVGAKADDLRDYDFISDEKEPKRRAREMMKMVAEINGRLLPAAGAAEGAEVGCFTCHHGLERPSSLEDELLTLAVGDGVEATERRYRELRQRYFGSAAYDFRGGALNSVAEKLFREHGNLDGALALVRLNLEFDPEDTYSLIILAQGLARQGDRDGSIATLEKALAIEPGNKYVRTTLERLQEMDDEDPAGGR